MPAIAVCQSSISNLIHCHRGQARSHILLCGDSEGTVISADLDLIGQMQPNQRAGFVAVTLEEALEARRVYKKRLKAMAGLFAG